MGMITISRKLVGCLLLFCFMKKLYKVTILEYNHSFFFPHYEPLEEEPAVPIDLSCFSGNLKRDDRDNARDCWKISDGNNFRVRSKRFCYDKTKVHLIS